MPSVRHACSTPGCPHTAPQRGRCATCQADAMVRRPAPRPLGYDTTWERRRAAFLSKPANLWCRLCSAIATVADHWPTSRRDLIRQGVRDPDSEHRLRPLCDPCHRSETARLQPGGWNRR